MPWLQLSNFWLLTVRSQVEAKGRTKDLNGSQESEGMLLETRAQRALTSVQTISTFTHPF